MTKPKPKHPLPGYPVKEKFKSREAVENYLSDDRITCLICGRSYKALGGHLKVAHGISGDEYKDMFNIPYNYGLARETTRKKFSDIAKNRAADPKFAKQLEKNRDKINAMREAGTLKTRPKRDFIIAEHTERALRMAGHDTVFGEKQKREFIDALESGKTQTEALENMGYSKSTLFDAKRRDSAFKEMVERTIEKQPFSVQAAQQSLGKRFEKECTRLRGRGYTYQQIADKLGVTAMSVHRKNNL